MELVEARNDLSADDTTHFEAGATRRPTLARTSPHEALDQGLPERTGRAVARRKPDEVARDAGTGSAGAEMELEEFHEAGQGDRTGVAAQGSAKYSFDVGPEHPLQAEVLETLTRGRERRSYLRQCVNERAGRPEAAVQTLRVVAPAGESVFCDDEGDGDSLEPR